MCRAAKGPPAQPYYWSLVGTKHASFEAAEAAFNKANPAAK